MCHEVCKRGRFAVHRVSHSATWSQLIPVNLVDTVGCSASNNKGLPSIWKSPSNFTNIECIAAQKKAV